MLSASDSLLALRFFVHCTDINVRVVLKKFVFQTMIFINGLIAGHFVSAAQLQSTDNALVYQQQFDWLQLKSSEWLKGDILSLYDEQLEFDSVELGIQSIDISDISGLRSRHWQRILLLDGTEREGYLIINKGKLVIVRNSTSHDYPLSQLLSISPHAVNEIDYWSGSVDLGLNFRQGNTTQFDYTLAFSLLRKSTHSRLKINYLANFSRYEEQSSGQDIVTADSNRLTAYYDWFFAHDIYFRAMDFEYYADDFVNIDQRLRYGISVGYQVIDNKKITWSINAGPSYQVTKFNTVPSNEADKVSSPGLLLGSNFSYEVTSDINFEMLYDIQIVDGASGDYIHHLKTAFEVELINNFDLDVTLYADRTQKPKPDGEGNTPEQNDFRLVISLGYDF